MVRVRLKAGEMASTGDSGCILMGLSPEGLVQGTGYRVQRSAWAIRLQHQFEWSIIQKKFADSVSLVMREALPE
jgi:hypothetical protein